MGRFDNAATKLAIQRSTEYTKEQKNIICTAVDKHGAGIVQLFGVFNKDDFPFTANTMRIILKFIDTVDSTDLAYMYSLSNMSFAFYAGAYNCLLLKQNERYGTENSSNFLPYEENILKTFYAVVHSIDGYTTQQLSDSIGTSEKLSALQFASDKLINPYLKEGFEGDIFPIEALYKIQEACRQKVDVLRLLDCRYTPDQIKLLTNAMLNGVDNETLDRMCAPELTYQEMFNIEYGEAEHSAEQELYNLMKLCFAELSDNYFAKRSQEIREVNFATACSRTMTPNSENFNNLRLFMTKNEIATFDEIFSECFQTVKLDYLNEHPTNNRFNAHVKKGQEGQQIASIDALISRATAISEQSRGLADDLRNRFKYEELLND